MRKPNSSAVSMAPTCGSSLRPDRATRVWGLPRFLPRPLLRLGDDHRHAGAVDLDVTGSEGGVRPPRAVAVAWPGGSPAPAAPECPGRRLPPSALRLWSSPSGQPAVSVGTPTVER